MQVFIEMIRKVVVLVLIMEVLLQLQSGKQYEPYLKMFVGLVMAYSLVVGIMGVFGRLENGTDLSFLEYKWSGNWNLDNFAAPTGDISETENTSTEIEQVDIPIQHIELEKIEIERIGSVP